MVIVIAVSGGESIVGVLFLPWPLVPCGEMEDACEPNARPWWLSSILLGSEAAANNARVVSKDLEQAGC